jgi:hypothetical protein
MSETAWAFIDAEYVSTTVEYGHVVDEAYWKILIDRYGSIEDDEPCAVIETTVDPEACSWWKLTRADAEKALIEHIRDHFTTDLRDYDSYEVELSGCEFQDEQQDPALEQLEQEQLAAMGL